MNFKIHRISKGEKINCGKNCSVNTTVNLKPTYVREEKKNAIISNVTIMCLCNVLRRIHSDFFPTGTFPRTLPSLVS